MNVPNQTAPPEKKETGPQPVFSITVEDPQKVGDPSVRSSRIQFKPRHIASEFASVSAVVNLSSRPLLQHFPSLRFPFFVAIRTVYGCTKPFRPITLEWLFLPFPRRVLFGCFDDQLVQQWQTALENCIKRRLLMNREA